MATATLGVQIETSSAAKAATDLDKFAQSAGRAESAVGRAASNVIPFRQAVDAVGASTRQTANVMRNLSFQVNDIATGLASGQSPFQILAQQGGQVYQVLQMGPGGVGGSLQAIKNALLGLITPARLAIGALGALAAASVAIGVLWKNFSLRIDDAARSAGIAQEQFSRMQAAASFKGISGGDFNDAMKSFAQNVDTARFGTGELFKLFDANKKTIGTNSDAMGTLADLVKGAKTETQALYYLQLAGLPPTMEWLRLLQGGADALERAKKEAAAFAANDDMIRKAREVDEAWNKMWTNFSFYSKSAITEAVRGLSDLGGEGSVFYEIVKRLKSAAGNATPTPEMFGLSMPKESFGPPMSAAGGKSNAFTIDPRSIKSFKEATTAVDSLAEAMRRLNEQRTTALEKAQRETTELLSFTGASRSAALAQAELAKYRERNIAVTPQLESEIRAWAGQLAAVQDLNKAIRTVKDSVVDFTQSLVSGLMQGQGLMQSLGGAAKSLSSSLVSGGIQNLAQGNLITGALQVGGGLLANLFGGNSQQKQQQQQQAQQQALQAQQAQQQQVAQQAGAAIDYRRQAVAVGLNTQTQIGAMMALELDIASGREQAARTGGAAIIAFEELAQAKRLQLEKEWAEKAESIRRDYLDREFAALNDTSTLSGKLAEYERKASREREEAVRNGGIALIELDRAQAAERGRLLKDALKEQTDYYTGLRNTISDFTRGLQFGNLSTLSPAEQFLAARNDFQRQLELAQGGDRAAQGGITNVAQNLLEQARSYLGPSVAFGELKDRVTAQLSSLTDIAMSNDSQMQELQRMGAYTGQLVQLQTANNESAEDILAELSRMRLDLKQALETIKLRAA